MTNPTQPTAKRKPVIKLKLTYIPYACAAVKAPHYDLHTDEKRASNLACIMTDQAGAKLIRKWMKRQ